MKAEQRELYLKGTRYCVSFNVKRTARAITNLYESALRPAGLRSTGFTILVAVAKFEPIAVGALAKMLVLDSTTMTRNLRLLQKGDLLSISARASRRQRFVTLLPKGRKVLRNCVPLWRQVQKRLVDKIGPDCWRALQDALEKLSVTAAELGNLTETSESKGNGHSPFAQRPVRERKLSVSPSIQVKPQFDAPFDNR
jgi:DNA-binding MarR family transcriptional regulator